MLSALRDDALDSADDGLRLRLSLPWIRSLPLACVLDPVVTVDGGAVPGLRILVGERALPPAALADEPGWWYLQDRLVIGGDRPVSGVHHVTASFRLLVPYLPGGGDQPLILPFRFERDLAVGAVRQGAGRDVA